MRQRTAPSSGINILAKSIIGLSVQVEALIVEILRLQEVVVDKHHPFAGQHHCVAPLHPTQSAVADQGHVEKRDRTPYLTRENAYSQMHADNILSSFLTQLQNLEEEEEEGDEDCDGREESATFSAAYGETSILQLLPPRCGTSENECTLMPVHAH